MKSKCFIPVNEQIRHQLILAMFSSAFTYFSVLISPAWEKLSVAEVQQTSATSESWRKWKHIPAEEWRKIEESWSIFDVCSSDADWFLFQFRPWWKTVLWWMLKVHRADNEKIFSMDPIYSPSSNVNIYHLSLYLITVAPVVLHWHGAGKKMAWAKGFHNKSSVLAGRTRGLSTTAHLFQKSYARYRLHWHLTARSGKLWLRLV